MRKVNLWLLNVGRGWSFAVRKKTSKGITVREDAG